MTEKSIEEIRKKMSEDYDRLMAIAIKQIESEEEVDNDALDKKMSEIFERMDESSDEAVMRAFKRIDKISDELSENKENQ